LQPQVGELLLIELEHEARREAVQIAIDLLVKPLGRLAIERRQVGIQHHPLAPDQVDALGDLADGQGRAYWGGRHRRHDKPRWLASGGASTDSWFDANGFLVATDRSESTPDKPLGNALVNDAQGRVLHNNQGAARPFDTNTAGFGRIENQAGGFIGGFIGNDSNRGHVQRQLIVNGEVLARYGDELVANGTGTEFTPTSVAEFQFGAAPMNVRQSNLDAQRYTVSDGETLRSIARSFYGDDKLWYLIAQANGLSGSTQLSTGQTLSIPKLSASSNAADSFKPYDPSKVVGDLTPNLPMPQNDKGCGGLGQIIMIVVAIVVTIYTAGAMSGAAAQFGGSFMSTMQAGMGVMTGGTVGGAAGLAGYTAAATGAGVLGLTGTAAVMATGALAAGVGSVASQVVGNAIGAVDGFSWKGVALSALSGGIGAGMGALGASSGPLSGGGINAWGRAAIGNALGQGIGVVTGLQDHFDWRGVAASAVGAGVGQAVGGAFGDAFRNTPVGQFGARFATGLVAGAAAAAMRGGKVAIQQVATDAFGNALGESIAGVMMPQNSAQESFRLGEINEQNAQARADATYGWPEFSAGGGLGMRRGNGESMRFDGLWADGGSGVEGGYVPSNRSYQFGELGSGTYGLGLDYSSSVLAPSEGTRSLRFNGVDPRSISYGDSRDSVSPVWHSDMLGQDMYSPGTVMPFGVMRTINGPAIGYPYPETLPTGASTTAMTDATGRLFFQVNAPGVNVLTAYDPNAVAPTMRQQASLPSVAITAKRMGLMDSYLGAFGDMTVGALEGMQNLGADAWDRSLANMAALGGIRGNEAGPARSGLFRTADQIGWPGALVTTALRASALGPWEGPGAVATAGDYTVRGFATGNNAMAARGAAQLTVVVGAMAAGPLISRVGGLLAGDSVGVAGARVGANGGVRYTGLGTTKYDIASEAAYADIRALRMTDVEAVAQSSGLTMSEAVKLKKQLFFGRHEYPIDGSTVVRQRFAATHEIAFAWRTASEGELSATQQAWIRQLADHELAERSFMAKGIPYLRQEAWNGSSFGTTPPGAHNLAPRPPNTTFPGYRVPSHLWD